MVDEPVCACGHVLDVHDMGCQAEVERLADEWLPCPCTEFGEAS